MKKNYLAQGVSVSLLILLSISVALCKRERNSDSVITPNLILEMSAYNTPATAALIPNIRLFTFHKQVDNKRFSEEILNVRRAASQLTARIKTGDWDVALISAPHPAAFLPPSGDAKSMAETPLYVYAPQVDPLAGKSSNAHEIFTVRESVSISTDAETAISTRLDRNVAMIEIIIDKTTANFDKAADHAIFLHHVPSTISYTGRLLPDRHAPDTLPGPLRARLSLEDHPREQGYLHHKDTIRFLVPAHRGSDFLAPNPLDTTTLKMRLSVDLQRTGGTRFIKSGEIPLAAKCNRVLRVRLTINDGVFFATETLPWNEVNVSMAIGESYSNWLYVKRGETGSGQSWSDPLPDVSAALQKALVLQNLSIPLNGILVAGGDAVGAYDDSFAVPRGMKIFGGWPGVPGSELPASDPAAPYTSEHRDLSACKAILTPALGSIVVAEKDAVLDGFIIRDVAGTNPPLVLNHASAWINAIEVRDNTSAALSLLNGVATNLLVSNNSTGLTLAKDAKLVNATIVANAAPSTLAGALHNSVYWGNTGSPSIAASAIIINSAFNGVKPPSGANNIAVNDNNLAWFSAGDTIPGPHFSISKGPAYSAAAATPNRSPLLGRGSRTAFDAVTAAMIMKTDVNGNPRHNDTTDIGCHEGVGHAKGFNLRWNMTSIYISTKSKHESEHPAILLDNDEGAYVKWWVSAKKIESSRYSLVAGATSGQGTSDNLGIFKLKSSNANTSNKPVSCGKITLHSNLGAYLPDVDVDVYQTPGASSPWTAGYAGSFHRNSEVEERLIFGSNTGEWTVRIVSGVDWIKIDDHPRGYANGIVEETFDGTLSGSGDIYFRVGMQSALPPGAPPRYGMITINRAGGAALFFVRQGEEADYIYGPESPGRDKGRANAVKFSPYNLTDPLGRFDANGVPLGKAGGAFVDYPSKTGYYFKFSDHFAFYPDNSIPGTKLADKYVNKWNDDNDPCPPGYHTPSNPEFVESYFMNKPSNEKFSGGANTTFVWGRIADGYFDRNAAPGSRECGAGPDRATEGLLIYNDYNNASVFFPMASKRLPPNDKIFDRTDSWGGGLYVQFTLTRTEHDGSYVFTTHSYGAENGHLGMSCLLNETKKNEAASVRCVKD